MQAVEIADWRWLITSMTLRSTGTAQAHNIVLYKRLDDWRLDDRWAIDNGMAVAGRLQITNCVDGLVQMLCAVVFMMPGCDHELI